MTERQPQRLREAVQAASATFGASVPHVFLKSVALDAAGRTARGALETVDVLVPAERRGEALQALQARGLLLAPDHLPPAAHRLPTLLAPQGAKLEVQVHLPGLRLGAERHDAEYRDMALHQVNR